MRTQDLLAVYDHLSTLAEVDPERVSLVGEGNEGVIALCAAAIEPRIKSVVMSDSILSYLDVTRANWFGDLTDIIVPGVLLDYDLPDLARLMGGRLVLLRPRRPNGTMAPAEEASRKYGKRVRVIEAAAGPNPELISDRSDRGQSS
jgi:hypothetical protein